MFSNLSEKLTNTVRSLTGRGRLTEDNIKVTLREIRMALLEADVALLVVKKLIEEIKAKVIGQSLVNGLEGVLIGLDSRIFQFLDLHGQSEFLCRYLGHSLSKVANGINTGNLIYHVILTRLWRRNDKPCHTLHRIP